MASGQEALRIVAANQRSHYHCRQSTQTMVMSFITPAGWELITSLHGLASKLNSCSSYPCLDLRLMEHRHSKQRFQLESLQQLLNWHLCRWSINICMFWTLHTKHGDMQLMSLSTCDCGFLHDTLILLVYYLCDEHFLLISNSSTEAFNHDCTSAENSLYCGGVARWYLKWLQHLKSYW